MWVEGHLVGDGDGSGDVQFIPGDRRPIKRKGAWWRVTGRCYHGLDKDPNYRWWSPAIKKADGVERPLVEFLRHYGEESQPGPGKCVFVDLEL